MAMTNHVKRKTIIPWIDPEERVTVHFLDEKDLNAEVTGTTEELVDLSIETNVPHMRQRISVPLRPRNCPRISRTTRETLNDHSNIGD